MMVGTWKYDWGMACAFDTEVTTAAELIRRLYEDLGEATGGPLHAILDDGNIYDDDIYHYLSNPDRYAYLWNGDFVRWAQAGDDVSEQHRTAIQDTCEAILLLFDGMTESRRASALAWANGYVRSELPAVADLVASLDDRLSVGEMADQQIALVHGKPIKVLGREPVAKACVPVACPPFTDVKLDVTKVFDQNSGLWHAPGEADRILRAEGIAYSEFLGRFMPVTVEVDPKSPEGAALLGDALEHVSISPRFSVSVDEVRASMPQMRWVGLNRPQVASSDRFDFTDGPLIVGVPEGYDPVAVSSAVALCQSLGLLPDTPHGVLFMPEGAETDLPD